MFSRRIVICYSKLSWRLRLKERIPYTMERSCLKKAKLIYFVEVLHVRDSQAWTDLTLEFIRSSRTHLSHHTCRWVAHKIMLPTGKSVWEALVLAPVNPQYEDRLLIKLQVQYKVQEKYKFRTCCVQKLSWMSKHNMFWTCIFLVLNL